MVCPFNEELIDLVQSNPALYNSNLPGYKSDEFKLKIWNDISEQLGEDVEVCRRRWRSLRSRYRRELLKIERGQKVKKSKANTRTWMYFDKMGFVFDFLRVKEYDRLLLHRNAAFAIENLSSGDEEDSSTAPPPDKKLIVDGSFDTMDLAFAEQVDPPTSSKSPTTQQIQPFQANNSNGIGGVSLRKSLKPTPTEPMGFANSSSVSNGPRLSRNLFDQFQLESSCVDECDLFGRLIAMKMRNLENPIDLQIIILNVIKEHEREGNFNTKEE